MKLKPVFVTAALFFTFISAQEKPDSTHSLKAGSWALQFGISNNFTLSNFNGSTFSGKYHLTDQSAIRLSITANGQNGEVENIESARNKNNKVEGSYPIDNYNVSIKPVYIFYPSNSNNFNFYFGAGPLFNLSSYKSGNSYAGFNADTLYSKNNSRNKRDGFEIGFTGLAGVEYFVTSYFSIHAEYSASLTYQIQKQEYAEETIYMYEKNNPRVYYSNNKSKLWKFYPGSVLFGLSVYL